MTVSGIKITIHYSIHTLFYHNKDFTKFMCAYNAQVLRMQHYSFEYFNVNVTRAYVSVPL